jgi:hypothetical protein
MRTRLTDRFVRLGASEGRTSPILMDNEVIGFGIQFRQTSFTLGSSAAAREHAKQIKRQVAVAKTHQISYSPEETATLFNDHRSRTSYPFGYRLNRSYRRSIKPRTSTNYAHVLGQAV